MSSSYSSADALSRFHMMQRVVDMFDGNPTMQNIIQYSLWAQMQNEDEDCEVVEDYGISWDNIHVNKKSSKKMTYAQFIDMESSGLLDPYAADSEDDESDAEREAKLLLTEKKIKEKAEKRRLKKQRQKERKRVEKELQDPTQEKESKDVATQDKAGDKPCNNETKECLSLKDMAAALDSESSDYTSDASSDGENEELDLTSSFVTKAAQIARRQLEQKQENKEKKKTPVKEEQKMPEKSTCEESPEKKPETLTSSPKMENFIKISTELAMIGNKLASAGNFTLAVKYFTDAIKFNPTEFRLFGNRAFCFERMQEFEKSLNDAELSLSMSPGWVKGLFRKGRALAGLKRYKEAACAFKDVVKLDSSCTEAAQELARVQTLQLMEYGYTQDQSSNALILHGSVEKALEALPKLNKPSELFPVAPVPVQQLVNVTGLSPVLSAKMTAAAPPPPAQDASKSLPESLIPVHSNQTLEKSHASMPSKSSDVVEAPELFPVWVGNLSFSVTEPVLGNLFNKVGTVYSIRHLPVKRCAFINFTQQQHCDAAIQRYHGYELFGSKLAVRYPDRIPSGMNISKAAHISTNLQDEHLQHNLYPGGRMGYHRPIYPSYRSPYKY